MNVYMKNISDVASNYLNFYNCQDYRRFMLTVSIFFFVFSPFSTKCSYDTFALLFCIRHQKQVAKGCTKTVRWCLKRQQSVEDSRCRHRDAKRCT